MSMFKSVTLTALVAAGLSMAAIPADAQKARGQCVNKAGEGTNSTQEGAKSQAYEAILQATDWGMWSAWMLAGQKLGTAPGYAVSNVRFKCAKGSGLGYTCRGQATLCKGA